MDKIMLLFAPASGANTKDIRTSGRETGPEDRSLIEDGTLAPDRSDSAAARLGAAPPHRVLMLHNHYQIAGGEDESFEAEAGLLESRGHELVRYELHNDAVREMGALAAGAAAVWNPRAYRDIARLIVARRIDIVHAQNLFPLISPAACHAAAAAGVPVVQSIRNYRLFCLNSFFFRDGLPCEDCFGRVPWRGVWHGCYRGSPLASAAVATSLVFHRMYRTAETCVSRFIAHSDFTRGKCIAAGIPADRIALKPNFLASDPGLGPGDGYYALYAGRLSPEKGVATLLAAWREIGRALPLKVAGEGPLAAAVKSAGEAVSYLGRRPAAEVLRLMQCASLVIFPSEWYETFGRVAIEAFAAGTPVVASRIGAIAEIVRDGDTGALFNPSDPAALAAAVRALIANPGRLAVMRRNARAEYLAKYTAAANYHILSDIYRAAMADRRHPKAG